MLAIWSATPVLPIALTVILILILWSRRTLTATIAAALFAVLPCFRLLFRICW